MAWHRKYLLALLPAAITVGGWQTALVAWDFFGCQGNLKTIQPCFAGTIDLMPFMGLGLFWLQLASYVTVPVSIWMLISTGAQHLGSHHVASEP